MREEAFRGASGGAFGGGDGRSGDEGSQVDSVHAAEAGSPSGTARVFAREGVSGAAPVSVREGVSGAAPVFAREDVSGAAPAFAREHISGTAPVSAREGVSGTAPASAREDVSEAEPASGPETISGAASGSRAASASGSTVASGPTAAPGSASVPRPLAPPGKASVSAPAAASGAASLSSPVAASGATGDPGTAAVPEAPDDAPQPTPRPADLAREALRAARAKTRREAEEAAARGTRKRVRRESVEGVAGERARDLKTWLAGAFRMPPEEGAESEVASFGEGERYDEESAGEARTELPVGWAEEVGPADGNSGAQGGRSFDAPAVPLGRSESPEGAADDPAAVNSAAQEGCPSATPPTPPSQNTSPDHSEPLTLNPRSMASPSRDGDLRRTFPAFPVKEAPFGGTWWGRAWVEALEGGALDGKRLARGRGYAEGGHVDAITVTPGSVLAYVQGSRPRPYRVQVRLRTWGDGDWETFLAAAVERPGQLAALLDKEMPRTLAECGVPLLPVAGELEAQCSCPDNGRPCKHAAALCYQTARLLDADPFVLLLLRGRGERDLLDTLARRSAAHAARTAQDGDQGALPGVRAVDVIRAERRLPPPPPAPAPRHPEQPPAYPSVPGGPDSFALDQLATDAAARAHALLVTGEDEIGALTLWQDAVRLAAARPGSGLTAATRALYASLAAATGRTSGDLARAVAAWRQGGRDGLAVLEEPWDPPAGRFDRARPLLLAAGRPAFRPWRNHLTHPRGHLQLRYGQDSLWYAYESEPGDDDWWPRGAPSYDPVDALTEAAPAD